MHHKSTDLMLQTPDSIDILIIRKTITAFNRGLDMYPMTMACCENCIAANLVGSVITGSESKSPFVFPCSRRFTSATSVLYTSEVTFAGIPSPKWERILIHVEMPSSFFAEAARARTRLLYILNLSSKVLAYDSGSFIIEAGKISCFKKSL